MKQVVLGVDPGCLVAGFSIVEREGNRLRLIECGALKMSGSDSLPSRVLQFHDFFEEKIKRHGVTLLALETPFLGKNAQNFLKLGYLRGALYILGERYGLRYGEFAPTAVKSAVTGYGGADKQQVARVILRLFPSMIMPEKLDVTDAVAVSLCGVWKSDSVLC